jgi:signal transduction histidine kinase
VSDRGVGIGPDDLRRVCEPFYRADRSRTRATGGLGLGLALAKRIVEAHGGLLEIESELGHGTTARVWLPTSGARDGTGDR